jgi:myosin heavy subunit
MKTLAFSSIAVATLLLVGWQHRQLGDLRAENTTLKQSATEASQLKADLDKSAGMEAQDADQIDRLREENRDLLKLRNEVNQLREARATFEKVNAENQRLQEQVRNAVKTNAKQAPLQPILIRVENLYDRGLATPENALQTFWWAQHTDNGDAMSRCATPESWARFGGNHHDFDTVTAIEIVARRELNATTIQLGLQVHAGNNSFRDAKVAVTLVLQGGEWRVDMKSL